MANPIRRPKALVVLLEDAAGGAERITASVAENLASRGWQVHVHVAVNRGPTSFLDGALEGHDIEITYGRRRTFFSVLRGLALVLKHGEFDLTFSSHVHLNGLLSIARYLRLLRTRRLVARESTNIFDRFAGTRLAYYRAIYALYGAQDLIVAQTDGMRSRLSAKLPAYASRKIETLPNPVDLEKIQRNSRVALRGDDEALLDGSTNIVFCGRLVDVKRPTLALEAVARLNERSVAPARLLILGEGPLRGQLERLATELGVADHVRFLGSRLNPHQIMATASIGILTSVREGFPNVVLEMLACGVRKVVVTPCADGLDQLPDVLVSSSHAADELAQLISRAEDQTPDRSRDEALRQRSVGEYVAKLLGELNSASLQAAPVPLVHHQGDAKRNRRASSTR